MKLFRFHGGTAQVARERLKIMLAHERIAQSQPDLLGILHEEILAVIGRHVSFEPERVKINFNLGKSVSTLAVDIEIPDGCPASTVPQYSRLMLASLRDDILSKMNERII
jgi:cell division topological specificity factor